MKTRLTLITGLIIFISFNTFGQNNKIKKAEKLYNSYSYTESIDRYEEVEEKSSKINRDLAQSYFNVGKFKKSEKYYEILTASNNKTINDIYNYASVLAINKKYEDAEKWMNEFSKLAANDSRGILWTKNKGFHKALQKDKGQFKIESLTINSKQEDFGVAYYKDKVVFASSKQGLKPIKRRWNWNNLPFLDIYLAEPDENMQFQNVSQFHKKYNKKYHEGPASFNKEGDFMAFTRNNYKHKSKDGIVKLELYTSEFKHGKWKRPKAMPFNSREYSVGHPSLTVNGDTMYFASDKPGGYGGVDLYMTKRNKKGRWSRPINLGDKINTEGNEMFPFIHKNKYLFYSSNGLLGLGGLDVFYTKITDRGYGKVENIGIPVNSSYDDFAFVVDEAMKTGYFSSNRIDGEGDDDIYLFKLLKPFSDRIIIKGTARDKDGNILSEVKVNLYDKDNSIVGSALTKKDGAYEFKAKRYLLYSLDGKKTKYSDGNNTADTHTDEYVVIADLELERILKFSLYCLISDAKTLTPLDDVKITFKNNYNDKIEIINTTETGDFFRNLKNKKLNDSINYYFLLEKNGYITKSLIYEQELYREGQYDVHEVLDFTMDQIEIGDDLSKIIDVNPIFFDLNKANIRPDAAIELDKIVKVMNENPDMEIELGSHTDCRGSAIYNFKLSDRRAKSSADYIKSRISKPERIYGKGYGETKLVNKCKCEGGVKIPCSKEEHQANRRTEFRIIKM